MRHSTGYYTSIYIITLFLFAGCVSGPHREQPEVPPIEIPPEIRFQQETLAPEQIEKLPLAITFAGDIMAHNVNFNMPDYAAIYSDLTSVLLQDDLSFANLETPVVDSLPMTTYPRFNVHDSYVKAAIAGGFDVFALANNHSNDQGIDGINGTLAVMDSLSSRIYVSGLKQSSGDTMQPVLIQKNGWRILFLSVTEILNSYDASADQIYYLKPDKESRMHFLESIRQMRQEHPCDFFILAIHLNEPEYVRSVSDSKKIWFRELATAGIDIVWGHHPHVMQEWETAQITREDGDHQVVFMYSMGNFISGQRYKPDYENPAEKREYTGDSVLIQIKITEIPNFGGKTMTMRAIPVTNYTNPQYGPVVRIFNSSFIESLPQKLQTYYQKRYALMCAYLPLLPLDD